MGMSTIQIRFLIADTFCAAKITTEAIEGVNYYCKMMMLCLYGNKRKKRPIKQTGAILSEIGTISKTEAKIENKTALLNPFPFPSFDYSYFKYFINSSAPCSSSFMMYIVNVQRIIWALHANCHFNGLSCECLIAFAITNSISFLIR